VDSSLPSQALPTVVRPPAPLADAATPADRSGTDHVAPPSLSRAELARLTGLSRAAITKACRAALAPAAVGARVAVEHPAVCAFLVRHGVAVSDALRFAAVCAGASRERSLPTSLLDLTLRQLLAIHDPRRPGGPVPLRRVFRALRRLQAQLSANALLPEAARTE
jgi:hypothetical protein